MPLRVRLLSLTVLAGVMCALPGARADQKLCLKDGSYQLVSSYEVRGDRVRYYSVERAAWEEIPRSLVDFEATKRAQEEEKARQKEELDKIQELSQQRFDKPAEPGYEIAPGIHLPQEEGVYAFDGFRVIRLIQSSAEVVTDKKRTALVLAMPAPILKGRSLVVLRGAKAAVRLQQAEPVFYVQSSDELGSKLELIPAKGVKESRVVEQIENARAGIGKASEVRTALEIERTQLAPGLYRLKPLHALDPGEYALGELIQKKLNLELWDFGVFETPTR